MTLRETISMTEERPGEEGLGESGRGVRTAETAWEWVGLATAPESVNLFVWRSSRLTGGFLLLFFKPITVLLLLLPDSLREHEHLGFAKPSDSQQHATPSLANSSYVGRSLQVGVWHGLECCSFNPSGSSLQVRPALSFLWKNNGSWNHRSVQSCPSTL